MKINEILSETSSSGATSAGSIAGVNGQIGVVQRRNPNGTAMNALDQPDNIFGAKIKKKNKPKK
jgi:hypothetical protein